MRSFSSTTMTSLKTIRPSTPPPIPSPASHMPQDASRPVTLTSRCVSQHSVGPTDLIDPRRHQSHSIIAPRSRTCRNIFQVDSDVYCARPSAPFRRPCFPRSPTHPRSHCGSPHAQACLAHATPRVSRLSVTRFSALGTHVARRRRIR